ncbi:hypothetical protein [Actinacidiphila rubida]|uniref:Uncharacterized protein n=1 Tax=Actinacidiphila rubida TaxID=310780 RepID=A0A1H8EY07_9ACTN|nr:hypothetical protein [Actinacidiphila rubida]SEN23757.1 hypothetical protein SAMN05216267_10037 [Actinacidiphila rubida]
MTVRLGLAGDPGAVQAVEGRLAAFLGRLVRWDKTAVVRLRSAEGEPALGVFGHPPFGGVLAVQSLALGGPAVAAPVDATVSAGELLEGLGTTGRSAEFAVPASVTGPAWAGLLPPRGGWHREAVLEPGAVREAAARTVAEFRSRSEELVPHQRTRAEMDALAEELWTRPLPGPVRGVTLRMVHAAHALGFLQPGAVAEAAGERIAVLSAGPWLRLRTGYGSVAMRSASAASGLTVSPRS